MKSSKLLISIIIMAFVLVAPAFAQSVLARSAPIRVTVPFDFTVGDHRLPAGDYRLAILHDSVLQVVHWDGSRGVVALIKHIGDGPHPNLSRKLVFHRYGDRSFLSQVWIGNLDVGYELLTSASELEYARMTKQGNVTVAAK